MPKIKGIPNLKYHFLVLWWNTVIPISAPMEPPISASMINFYSLTLHCLVIALHLSSPYNANVITLIMIRYKWIYADCICRFPPHILFILICIFDFYYCLFVLYLVSKLLITLSFWRVLNSTNYKNPESYILYPLP